MFNIMFITGSYLEVSVDVFTATAAPGPTLLSFLANAGETKLTACPPYILTLLSVLIDYLYKPFIHSTTTSYNDISSFLIPGFFFFFFGLGSASFKASRLC